MRYKLLLILFFVFEIGRVFAQSSSSFLDMAMYWERKGNLNSAVYFYDELFKENPIQPIGVYERYAALTLRIYAYAQSETYYRKVCLSDSSHVYPQAFFYWAMTLKNLSKYAEAIEALQKYQQTTDQDAILRSRLPIELAFLTRICSGVDSSHVEIEKLPSQINTSYSEFNAIEDNDKGIFFTTLRPLSIGNSRFLDDYYVSQIYMSPYSANGLQESSPLNKKINNNKYNNAGFCLNEEKDKLYFSRCLVEGKKTYWQIYVSQLDEHGEWGQPVLLPAQINAENSSNMQPFIVSEDNFEVLYFVSDRQGGFGGWDIWYCIMTADYVGEAVNVGSIVNTAGNELTPFYHQKTSKLYFSSDYHGGYGGLDIFAAKGALGVWNKPENLGCPINSSANDYYFSCNELANAGYFASNRVGSFHVGESVSCCYDIYGFTVLSESPTYFTDTIKLATYDHLKDKVTQVLPITLYFHNDEPNPRSKQDTTNENYANLLEDYLKMKDLYKKEYSKGLKGSAKMEAEQEIENFFTSQVAYGLELIDTLNKLLLIDLQNGYEVSLIVKGFASPLFTNEYNDKLSMRRIVSFENYIHQQPAFKDYLDSNSNGGKLRFVAEPKGMSYSEKYVSDNPHDKRNSIYSIAAARERRIQIMQYERSLDTDTKQVTSLSVAAKSIEIQQRKNIDFYRYFVEIRNSGASALIIDSVSCTSKQIDAQLFKKQIQPNETEYLLIEYKGGFDESENYTINIYFNQTNQEAIIVKPIAL